MNYQPFIFLSLLPFLASTACRTKTMIPKEDQKNMPAHESTAPPRKPNTSADPAATGTRTDYKPTTGPAGQQETNPQAPPVGTNPSPSNSNTPRPPNSHSRRQPFGRTENLGPTLDPKGGRYSEEYWTRLG